VSAPAKLLYSAAAGWACVCAPGFSGASCTSGGVVAPACAAGLYRYDNVTCAFTCAQ
jgi:hypothetical protein